MNKVSAWSLLALFLFNYSAFAIPTPTSTWTHWGGDLFNSHYARDEHTITVDNVKKLKPKWVLKLDNSVPSIPSYADGVLYFADAAPAPAGVINIFKIGIGNLNAVNAETGKKIWSFPLTKYTESKVRAMTKTTPAIYKDKIIFGDSIDNVRFIPHAFFGSTLLPAAKVLAIDKINGHLVEMPGASLFAVNRANGDLIWKKELDPHFTSRITQSPIVYQGNVYVGVSSQESQIPGVRAFVTKLGLPIRYKCCSFRSKFVSLNADTGEINWETYMIPPPPKGVKPHNWFSGAAIWGSSPSIDEKRGSIYIATGNNYNVPPAYKQCLRDAGDSESKEFKACAKRYDIPENRFESIVALDLKTGKIKWTYKSTIYDAWNVSCGKDLVKIPPTDHKACPNPEGKDHDFGQAPMILKDVAVKTPDGIKTMDLVVDAQKDGTVYALNADDGSLMWKTQDGPGGELGGHELGSATDGKTIFTQITNLNHKDWTLMGSRLKEHPVIKSGFWSAIDAGTGEILWETADPAGKLPLVTKEKEGGFHNPLYGHDLGMGHFAAAFGPITLANGLVFVGSIAKGMYALNAKSGEVLWSFNPSGSVAGAPTIINGVVYWGTGYPLGFDSNEFYAFSIDGK